MKKLILIIGAPGSGKTTDAELIAKQNSDTIVHYSTGDLLREEAASGSELGKTIASFVDNGNLCPVDVVINTIVTAIKNAPLDTILVDGLPRSIEQLDQLNAFLAKEDQIKLLSVIEVVVSEDTARERVLGRARGADDNERVFTNRMKVYLEPLDAIQKHFTSLGILKQIDGSGSIESIVSEMQAYIITKI